MPSIHRTPIHGTSYSVDPLLFTSVLLLVVLAFHLTRALQVRRSTAERWVARRGLVVDERSLAEVETHLRRTHWARCAGTLVVGAVSLTLVVLSHPSISFVSLPLLVGVLIAELMVPEPR